MDVGRRRGGGIRNGVAAGSIWESRMIIDEVKGGIKVFNGDEAPDESAETPNGGGDGAAAAAAGRPPPRRLKPVGSPAGKRKTWKSESSSSDGFERPSILQIAKGRSEPHKSPVPSKARSEDGIERSPLQLRKTRSEKAVAAGGEPIDGIGKKSQIQLRKSKSESSKILDEPVAAESDGSEEKLDKDPPLEMDKSQKTFKDFGVCHEKVITSSSIDGENKDGGDEEIDGEVAEEIEIKTESKSIDVIKEINVLEDESSKKGVMDEEKKKITHIVDKPLPISPNLNRCPPSPPIVDHHEKPLALSNHKKPSILSPPIIDHPEKPLALPDLKKPSIPSPSKPPISASLTRQSLPNIADIRKQSSPDLVHLRRPNLRKTTPFTEESQNVPETSYNKLQNLVDLVMWRDVSKSALIFGIGTFFILSSSYTDNLNISFISVMSYIGLLYLAAIFLYKSVICRGVVDVYDSNQYYVLGEEEAIWLLKLFLPYMNEFLLKIRTLFSGDPAKTMKLAVLLFVLARCGSSITIWKMVKLGFFGAFTVPKVYSLYSIQITGYAEFWVRRFRDAWESCSHKKAVAGAIFTLVWNLSSVVARIWAVFVLFVAVRYYQYSLVRDHDWAEEDAGEEVESWQGLQAIGGQRRGRGPTIVEIKKEKKAS